MMTHNLNTAEYEYAVSEAIDKDTGPVPQQVPKRFMILLLKGCSTEFVNDSDRMSILLERFTRCEQPYLVFKYSDALQCYEMMTEAVC